MSRRLRLFILQFGEMTPVNCVRSRKVFLIPAGIACLIATNKQDAHATRIESKQNSVGSPLVLASQFLHVRILRTLHCIRVWAFEPGSAFLKQPYSEVDAFLLAGSQAVPPEAEVIGELDFHATELVWLQMHYGVKCIFCGNGN